MTDAPVSPTPSRGEPTKICRHTPNTSPIHPRHGAQQSKIVEARRTHPDRQTTYWCPQPTISPYARPHPDLGDPPTASGGEQSNIRGYTPDAARPRRSGHRCR